MASCRSRRTVCGGPWLTRVSQLCYERKSIYKSFAAKLKQEDERIQRELGQSWRSDREKAQLKKDKAVFEKEKLAVESAPKYETPEDMVRALLQES